MKRNIVSLLFFTRAPDELNFGMEIKTTLGHGVLIGRLL